jgi:Tol biopolymer transport system component
LLAAGTKLGPYEIVSPLGAGGMGEVYRARDGRLGREVAIKVLPVHLSANPEVRARFEREARTISGLNHPNICTLFDVGAEGETDYLVLELVEGETLAERLKRGPLPAPELLRIGMQLTDALDRAHRAGVVHRDLKPGNIMLTRSGAKLMDFGLARATGLAGGGSDSSRTLAALTQSPTVATPLTAEGSIVGTFQYMSPEQLEGREADTRSDLWALGCVLYEMATGRRAFEGRSQASLIAAILEREPAPIEPASGAPPSGNAAPAGLDRLVRALLVKDPEERIQTAHDVKLQLRWIAEGAGVSSMGVPASSVTGAAVMARPGRSSSAPWIVAGVALAAAIGVSAWALLRPAEEQRVFRFQPEAGIDGVTDTNWPRVSPDGRSLLFQASDSTGASSAYLMRFDETRAHLIDGTRGLQRAYWSPDSREIAFCADGKLLRLPVAGGSTSLVCPAPGGADLSWGAKGTILMDGRAIDSIRAVPAGGGELRPATRIDRAHGETGSAWPCFLPDGEHFLFVGNVNNGVVEQPIHLARLGSLDSKVIGTTEGRVEYAPGGWVLFVRNGSLVAQKLDMGAARLVGQTITLVENLRTGSALGHFSVTSSGVLAFGRGGGDKDYELQLVDRSGTPIGKTFGLGYYGNPSLSPDGSRVLVETHVVGAPWGEASVLDLARGTETKLPPTGGLLIRSAWSPDGQRVAYTRNPVGGPSRIIILSVDNASPPDSIPLPSQSYLGQWLATGPQLVYYDDRLRAFSVPSEGASRTPRALTDSTLVTVQPALSPDGRWLAMVSGSASSYYVYVQDMQGSPRRWQVSPAQGSRPTWTKGGREIVYEGRDGRLMAIDVDTTHGFQLGQPKLLFSLPVPALGRDVSSWSVDEKGERFVIERVHRVGHTGPTIEVVTSFASLVNRH